MLRCSVSHATTQHVTACTTFEIAQVAESIIPTHRLHCGASCCVCGLPDVRILMFEQVAKNMCGKRLCSTVCHCILHIQVVSLLTSYGCAHSSCVVSSSVVPSVMGMYSSSACGCVYVLFKVLRRFS
jgi:hypothetical protein